MKKDKKMKKESTATTVYVVAHTDHDNLPYVLYITADKDKAIKLAKKQLERTIVMRRELEQVRFFNEEGVFEAIDDSIIYYKERDKCYEGLETLRLFLKMW